MAILERELIRLRDESTKGRYNLQGMLHHHHAECHRNDLIEIRLCQVND
jgi:hypothetical protein